MGAGTALCTGWPYFGQTDDNDVSETESTQLLNSHTQWQWQQCRSTPFALPISAHAPVRSGLSALGWRGQRESTGVRGLAKLRVVSTSSEQADSEQHAVNSKPEKPSLVNKCNERAHAPTAPDSAPRSWRSHSLCSLTRDHSKQSTNLLTPHLTSGAFIGHGQRAPHSIRLLYCRRKHAEIGKIRYRTCAPLPQEHHANFRRLAQLDHSKIRTRCICSTRA